MADYYTTIVVQTRIPLADMTPLERLVLDRVFNSEIEDGEAYFHKWDGPYLMPCLPAGDLRQAFAQSADTASRLADLVREILAKAAPDAADIELDLSMFSYEPIFQDIVRRSQTLGHVSIVASFDCSKMRPDGFGGMAILISDDEIFSDSTDGLIEKWLALVYAGACPKD
ncbi:hypothetical protein JDN40_00640 [Rhodomicrobium vannielii ATCC 17100]|uniref:hypothetical protein n=1 Tax=Rhodomicrobium vannielii TaxID=1069 RepID=UPI00191859F8|nr:hypothetical protein [Rhodomicrobium vannielii]MBJ7532641.1 hypothetical protein [Rhodomicrobium vannielii ATCC 17100]